MNLKPMDKVKWDMLPGVYTVIQIMKQYGVTYLRGEDGMIRQAEIEDLHKYTPSVQVSTEIFREGFVQRRN